MDLRKSMTKDIISNMLIEEIKRKNYKFFYTVYDELELYDNKRIISKGKNCRKILPTLTDSIFEIIVSIIIEEIYEKDNIKLFNMLMSYYGNAFSYVKRAFDRNKGNLQGYYWELKDKALGTDEVVKNYIFLYYITHDKGNTSSAIELQWKEFQDTEQQKKLNHETYVEIMEKIWEMEGLNENKIYQRFLEKQRQILADYLEIEADAIEEHIVYLCFMTKDASKEEITFTKQGNIFFLMEESLFKIMDKLGISTDCIESKEVDKCKLIVKENFENLCGALVYYKFREYRLAEKDFTLSMIIRHASIENVKAFYVGLISSFYFELLGGELCKVLESYQQVFSFDKLLGVNKEKQMLEKIDKLQTKVEDYKNKLNAYTDERFQDKQKQYSMQKNENREYIEQINQLQKQLAVEIKENEKAQERIKIQEEYIELLEMQEETEAIPANVDLSLISNKKFVFIGGMQGVVIKLKELFPQSLFVNDEAVRPPQAIDAIIMFPKFMNHVLFYKYISIAREKGIEVIYCNGTNIDSITSIIYCQYRK